jgi:hypothetical protein
VLAILPAVIIAAALYDLTSSRGAAALIFGVVLLIAVLAHTPKARPHG